MDGPRVERGDGRVRFHDADGGAWTVYDCTFSGGRPRRVAHEDPRAVYRYFVAPDGTRRLATLKPGGDRRLVAALLAVQLRGAGYAPRERYEPPSDAPGRPGG